MRPAGFLLAFAVGTVAACDVTDPFEELPTLAILSPGTTDTIYVGQVTALRSVHEARASAPTVVWESDVDGWLGTGDTVVVAFQTAGPHVLTATLAAGDTVFDVRSVAIRVRPNHAPHVELDYAWVQVSPGQSVTLNVQAVDVEDGLLPPSTILWTTTDGRSRLDTTFSFVPTLALTVVRVTAMDSHGATGKDSALVHLYPPPAGPSSGRWSLNAGARGPRPARP